MALITQTEDGFVSLVRPLGRTTIFNGVDVENQAVLAAAPCVLDLYQGLKLNGQDDLLLYGLVEGVVRMGYELLNWGKQDEEEFRSSVWRSAHAYVVSNVHRVDRGAETDALAKLLGVDRK